MKRPISHGTANRPDDFHLAHSVQCAPRKKGRRELLFGLGPGAARSDASIDDLVRLLLSRGASGLAEPGSLWFGLVIEGFSSGEQMRLAWRGLSEIYRGPFGVCLDWTAADGRLQRRLLGPTTVLSATRQTRIPHYDLAQKQWLDLVEKQTGTRPEPELLVQAVLGWLHTRVSGDIYAHITADSELTVVRRECLARLESRQALARTEASDDGASHLHLGICAAIADAAFGEGHADAVKVNEALVAIADACKNDTVGGSPLAQRKRMLRRLEDAALTVERAGGWAAVLWAWCVSLVEQGTRRTSPLAPNSIETYVRQTLPALAAALSNSPISEMAAMTETDWRDVRARTLKNVREATQHNKVRAAFTSWHDHLQDAHAVPQVAWPDDDEGPPLPPRANAIWDHEREWIQTHAAKISALHLSRFDRQVEAAFAFWEAQPTRAEDLWRVHMFGIRDDGTTLVLHLDPLDNTGKSLSARRPIEFVGRAAETLRRWIGQREQELKGKPERERLEALLFGSVHAPRSPWRIGATTLQVGFWLKAATGDPSVSMYTLRHSFLTHARVAARDQREMDLHSARAGHAATETSEHHYFHLPEVVLRHALDREFETVQLTAREVSAICGLSVAAICQRWHRRAEGITRGAASWQAIGEAAARLKLPSSSDAFNLCEPVPLAVQPDGKRKPTIIDVLHCLQDRSDGREDENICLRQGVSEEALGRMDKTLRFWHRQCGSIQALAQLQRRPFSRVPVPFAEGLFAVTQPKYRSVLIALKDGIDAEEAQQLTVAWRLALHGDRICLDDLGSVRDLLSWLKRIGITGEQAVVWSNQEHLAETRDEMETIFGQSPHARVVQQRSGRASSYFGLVEETVTPTPSSASVAGLNTMLFSVWVWQQLESTL